MPRMEKPSENQTFGDFLKQYGKYIAVVAVALVLIIIIVFSGKSGKDSGQGETTAPNTDVIDLSDAGETEAVTEANVLKEDAYPEINQLIGAYFTALRDQDMETLTNIMETNSEITAESIQKEGEYIEDYRNIKCYTKDGLVDGTYLVFVYYEIKFLNVETLAPSMVWMYVCTNEDGSLYINRSTVDGEVAAYIDEMLKSEEVTQLAESVNSSLASAMEQDQTLSQLVMEMKKGADPTIPEETQPETETQPEETQPEESQPQETEGQAEGQPSEETVYATQNVNVRKSPSAEGELAGQLNGGDSIKRIGTEGDWSKVVYDGAECYIKSEFLTTEQVAVDGFESRDETVEVLQNVRMRSEPSTESEDLGTLSGGTEVHRIGYSEQWSRVEYQSRTCYVSSEFLR